MADQERLTNKERREKARLERKQQEAIAAAQAKKKRTFTALFTTLGVAVVAGLAWLAFTSGPDEVPSGGITLTQAAALTAQETAGCEPVPGQVLEDRTHYEPGQAPPADSIYTSVRPTASGPHFRTPVEAGAYGGVVDERAITHSLEHGTIAVYTAPDVDADTASEIEAWVEKLNAAGFRRAGTGAGILSAEFVGPFTSGKPIAVRAWGFAADCDTFDEDAFNGYVIEHFGIRGVSPEAGIGGYPEGVLDYTDVTIDEQSPEPAPAGSSEPMDSSTEPTPDASETATDEPSDEPSEDASVEPTPTPTG